MVKFTKRVKKVYKKVGKYAKKAGKIAYKVGTSQLTSAVASNAYEIAKLASMLNAEKKNHVITTTGLNVGQVSANVSGHYSVDISPVSAQGITDITHVGDSIKICSFYFKFQFWDMTGTSHSAKIKITIVQVLGAPQSANTAITQFYKPNPMVTGASVYDTNAVRNTDFNNQYKVIMTKIFSMSDQYSGQTAIKPITLGMKMNHHLRFTANSATLSGGQILMFIQSDSGNINGSTASTLGGTVPILGVNTGLHMGYSLTWYYYDN